MCVCVCVWRLLAVLIHNVATFEELHGPWRRPLLGRGRVSVPNLVLLEAHKRQTHCRERWRNRVLNYSDAPQRRVCIEWNKGFILSTEGRPHHV